jgi:hypothetical protein
MGGSRARRKRERAVEAGALRRPVVGFCGRGCARRSETARLAWTDEAGSFVYAWKELPQPQLFTAFGLSNVKPRRSMPE